MKPFEPEFAGKMNFYLSAVDDQMRHEHDAPTIGLLLCKDAKDKLKMEPNGVRQIRRRRTRRARRGPRQYALRDVKKPIGVAEWQTRLVESLPTIADIERELNQPRAEKVAGKRSKF